MCDMVFTSDTNSRMLLKLVASNSELQCFASSILFYDVSRLKMQCYSSLHCRPSKGHLLIGIIHLVLSLKTPILPLRTIYYH